MLKRSSLQSIFIYLYHWLNPSKAGWLFDLGTSHCENVLFKISGLGVGAFRFGVYKQSKVHADPGTCAENRLLVTVKLTISKMGCPKQQNRICNISRITISKKDNPP